MKKQAWKKYVRYCMHCGKVGPRIHLGLGYVHKYCMTEEDKRTRMKLDDYMAQKRKEAQ